MPPDGTTAIGTTTTSEMEAATDAVTRSFDAQTPSTSFSTWNPANATGSNKPAEDAAAAQQSSPLPTPPTPRPPNHYEKANWISRLIFYWPYQLLQLGLKRPLTESDLPDIVQADTSSYNRRNFTRLWQDEIDRAQAKKAAASSPSEPGRRRKQHHRVQQPNLHRALLYDFIRSTWYVQPFICLSQMAKIVQAVALGYLIDTFEKSEGTNIGLDDTSEVESIETTTATTIRDSGYFWASILVVCGMIIVMEHHHVFFVTWRKGMKYRISAVSAIYAKSLKLSSTYTATAETKGTNTSATGQIMNLISNDVERFIMACLFGSHLVWVPLTSIVTLAVGWYILKTPAFAIGFLILVGFFVPLQIYLSHSFAYWRSKVASLTDQRVTFVSQAIQGVRVMKMSGYEYKFLEQIENLRRREISQIKHANTLRAYNESLFFVANVVLTILICIFHVLVFDGILTTRDVFTVVTLINILQLEMTKHMSLGVMGISECGVSISRIQKFLQFPELPRTNHHVLTIDQVDDSRADASTTNPSTPAQLVLVLDDVTSYWNDVQPFNEKNSAHPPGSTEISNHARSSSGLTRALSNITINFRMGELTCIVGTVGSGKSALLQAIVGELPIFSGSLKLSEDTTISYASQDPWIMDGTVKENILMGLDFNESWYNQVISACGLILDFSQFIHGDQTIVGDRGVQCSGGQRARIGLARAIYRDADILVADDPLSAVDSKVGRQLFNEALQGLALNRGNCVILATHQHQYVTENTCVLMEQGRIRCIGSYDDCVTASNGRLTAPVGEAFIEHVAEDAENINTALLIDSTRTIGVSKHAENGNIHQNPTIKTTNLDVNNDEPVNGGTIAVSNAMKEDKVAGVVHLSTYVNYFKAMGGIWVAGALLLLFGVTQASVLYAVAKVGRWAERPKEQQDSWDILGQVIGIGVLVIILAMFRAKISFNLAVKASQRLHDEMTLAVLRSKIEFFDTNPLGRILNRFSADVGSNDDLLPQTLFDTVVLAFMTIGTIVTTMVVLPVALLTIPPLVWYFMSVRRVFVTSSRELKRLEGQARSPIFAMLSESLSGISTIRANLTQDFFLKKFEEAHDAHTRAFFSFIASSRWVGFRMDSLMFLLMTLVSFLAVLFQHQGWFDVDPAILGLSISMLLQLAGVFQWCIRQSAEVVNQLVSVERVLGYAGLEPEAPLRCGNDDHERTHEWPSDGAIDFRDVAIRYRKTLPRALDGATFSIPGGARVGVVGRTGSGKSTVVQTLFRLLEAEEGGITIDGVDISTIGLHKLRTSISVIPQVPTLYSGYSVRENLDLFSIHSREAIEKALEDVQLTDAIVALPHGCDAMVSEGGSNFSVGQRQVSKTDFEHF